MKKKATKLTKAKIDKIRALKKKKWTERAIAKEVGCSRSTVWYWLQRGIGYGATK